MADHAPPSKAPGGNRQDLTHQSLQKAVGKDTGGSEQASLRAGQLADLQTSLINGPAARRAQAAQRAVGGRPTALAELSAKLNAGPAMQRLAAAQETANEAAFNERNFVQRISIQGVPFAPARQRGSPAARARLLRMVEQVLGRRNLSTHGTKGRFQQWVKATGDHASPQAAAESFVDLAVASGWAKPFKLNRPAWPDDISAQSEAGEDIRHIVRNATIKSALQKELTSNSDPDMAHDMMNMLAVDLGINDKFGQAPQAIMKAIYKKCYLNRGNLWSGPGAINRAIGLLADPLVALGRSYLAEPAIQIPARVVDEYFQDIFNLASGKVNVIIANGKKLHPRTQGVFFEGFDFWSKDLSIYLLQAQAQLRKEASAGRVSAYQIGTKMIQVGVNLGFDTPNAHPQIGELIRVEQFLAGYGGNDPDGLSDHLQLFLRIGGGMH